MYGWGASIIFLISTIVAHNVDGDHIKPGFGTNSCWFSGKKLIPKLLHKTVRFFLLYHNKIYVEQKIWSSVDMIH